MLRLLGFSILAAVVAFASPSDAAAQGVKRQRPAPQQSVRPLFVMGHHANTLDKLNNYMSEGATVIEHDIHMYTKPLKFNTGSDKIYIMHFMVDEFTRKYTNSDGVDAYYRAVKSHMDSGKLRGLICDIKPTFVSDGPIHYSSNYPNPRTYGAVVANILKRHGIPASRVVMGVDESIGSYKHWATEFMIGVRTDARYDCLVNIYVPFAKAGSPQSTIDDWANRIDADSDIGELGVDSLVRGFTTDWDRWLATLINRRDANRGALRFVYRWTLNSNDDFAAAVSRNVDGILTDKPSALISFLNSHPNKGKTFRIAGGNDDLIPAAQRKKRSFDDPNVRIVFTNKGAYDQRFSVSWKENGVDKSWESGKCMAGQGATCSFPKTATNVRVNGTWSNGSSYKQWKGYPINFQPVDAAFETTGTLIKGDFKRVR